MGKDIALALLATLLHAGLHQFHLFWQIVGPYLISIYFSYFFKKRNKTLKCEHIVELVETAH